MTRRIKNPTKSDKKCEFSIQQRTLSNRQIWLEEYAKYWTVAAACKSTGIHRDTYYEWIESSPEFAKKVKEIDQDKIEFAESKIYQAIQTGNLTATIKFLQTHSKKWRISYEQHIGGEVKSNFQLTDEQYKQLIERMAKQCS